MKDGGRKGGVEPVGCGKERKEDVREMRGAKGEEGGLERGEREGEREGKRVRGGRREEEGGRGYLSMHEGEDWLQQCDLLSHLKFIQLRAIVQCTLSSQSTGRMGGRDGGREGWREGGRWRRERANGGRGD